MPGLNSNRLPSGKTPLAWLTTSLPSLRYCKLSSSVSKPQVSLPNKRVWVSC
ncbi:hypothetical protein PFLmoz3_04442 [Pseudomonas fluorescens]|uniref:Uncharacterized protein n=1 Tax=Pseudomonas fluorescens TaxID=294 RepID=A0A125QHY0_PSEFL|nr:hypothetical protein PFLmoz3_04442 [Pseudomonas fluorescens]